MDQNQKAELIISALQQRIGEMAAAYELEKALLRAEYTQVSNELTALREEVAKAEYSQEVLDSIKNV